VALRVALLVYKEREMAVEITVEELLASKDKTLHSVAPDATVYDALKLLSEAKIGALPVIEAGKLVGIFSERDYARKIILEGRCSKDTPIRDVMTAGVCSVSPDQTVKECLTLMNKNRFRHLPVVQDNAVVGIVSIGDLVRAIVMSLL
jgi:CBS domain-containing protein